MSEFFEQSKEWFEEYVVRSMAEGHVPGLSIALVGEGRVIYARGFGARNLDESLTATPDTLYGIGSCTKSFTALAALQLAEKGLIDLHDPVKKYIPFKLGKEDTPITIHHLLSHSSGVPSLLTAEVLIRKLTGGDDSWIPMTSIDDFMLHVNGAGEEVADVPGRRYFYFNAGFTMVGQIIEKVGKMSYEQYVKEKILKPLRMSRSTFLKTELKKDPDIMTAYRKNKDGSVTATVHPFSKIIYAPGGMLSSAVELTRYLTMYMNHGVYENTQIITPSSIEKMHTIHIDTPSTFFGRQGYGYGWSIAEDFLGHKLIQHGGSTGVSSANVAFLPEENIGVALLANTSPFGPAAIPLAALALLLGKDPEKELPQLSIESKLNLLQGTYESYKGIRRISIVRKGPMLYFEEKNRLVETSVPLIPHDLKMEDNKFYIISGPGAKMPMEFEVSPEGEIDLYMERYRMHKVKA